MEVHVNTPRTPLPVGDSGVGHAGASGLLLLLRKEGWKEEAVTREWGGQGGYHRRSGVAHMG